MKNRSTIGNNTFIRQHLIEKVYDQIKEKQSILKHDHFFYFDKPIKNGKTLLDRVNRWNPFMKDDILPRTFYGIDGVSLIEVFKKLKSNDFYIYKNISGKSHKVRIKKK
jgi:hypothetical protein